MGLMLGDINAMPFDCSWPMGLSLQATRTVGFQIHF